MYARYLTNPSNFHAMTVDTPVPTELTAPTNPPIPKPKRKNKPLTEKQKAVRRAKYHEYRRNNLEKDRQRRLKYNDIKKQRRIDGSFLCDRIAFLPEDQKEKRRARQRRHWHKRVQNPVFQAHNKVRAHIRQSLKAKNLTKMQRSLDTLGCPIDFFWNIYWPEKVRIWNEWYPMHPITVENAEMDHIRPKRMFDQNDIHMLNHFTNLQPLPKIINGSRYKGGKWNPLDEMFWRDHIIHNPFNRQPYLPVNVHIFTLPCH